MTAVRTTALIMLAATACATSSPPGATDQATRTVGKYALVHEGAELDVALGFHRAARSTGEEWLIVAVELTAGSLGGRTVVNRSDISVITPDGRQLVLISEEEFLENYAAFRVALGHALRSLPILGRYDPPQMPCDRWFLRGVAEGFAHDVISINTFQLCSGPLVFRVFGGVQPGRWRLVIDLEESRVDIPFELGDGE